MRLLGDFIKTHKRSLLVFLLFFIVGSAIYGNILNAPFHYDDHELMIEHPLVRDALDVRTLWEEQRQKFVTYLTFILNYRVNQENPFGYHVVNVLIHIFTAFFLYRAMMLLFSTHVLSSSIFAKDKNLFSLFVALVFLTHPMQTQSVTYIWERTESLSGLFYLLCYVLYLRGRLRKQWIYYLICLALFCVGFFAKGIIASLPIMILLTEVTFFDPEKRRRSMKKIWPLWVVLGVLSLVPFLPFEKTAYVSNKAHQFFMHYTGFQLSKTYLFTQFQVILRYIKLCFVPLVQNLDYYFPLVKTFWSVPSVLSFSGVMAILFGAGYLHKKRPLMSFGIFWFFVGLLPTTFILREVMWEHRVYVSLAGFSIFIVALLFRFVAHAKTRNIIAIGIICVLSALTVSRNVLWRSPLKLMEDTVKKSSLKPRPNQVLGLLYYRKGDLDRALHFLTRAVEQSPNYAEAHNNLGLVYLKRGETEKAEGHFQKAIESGGLLQQAHINLATLSLLVRDYQRAEKLIRESMEFRVTEESYLVLGNISAGRKDLDQAQIYFTKALELNPASGDATYSLANIFFFKKDYRRAIELYQQALALGSMSGDTYLNLGMAFFYLKDYEKAKSSIERAIVINPNRADFYRNLAYVYRALNEPEKANMYYRKSRELKKNRMFMMRAP